MEEKKTQSEKWLDETVEKIPKNGPYKLACAIIGRKMKYSELIKFIENTNVRNLPEKELFEVALKEAISIYEFNNGRLPDGINKKTL